MNTVRVKVGRDASLARRHPWIFSGSLERLPAGAVPGETVSVVAGDGRRFGSGAVSPASQIAVRMWSFDAGQPIDAAFFARRLETAAVLRAAQLPDAGSTEAALRLVHSESEGIPGLIADRYGPWLVCQFLSAGAEYWKETLVRLLAERHEPRGIYERSDVEVRAKEGLAQRAGLLHGAEPPERVEAAFAGLRLYADLRGGHKTGLYLDQRDNIGAIRALAGGREVLNCFSYSGAFGIAALQGGAQHVTNIESAAESLRMLDRNLALNGLDASRCTGIDGDVFVELRRLRDARRQFDMVILDPPKFVANAAQLAKGSRGYKDINLLACKLLRPGGVLVTFSCSGHVGADLFQKIVADAALDAGRDARIVRFLAQSADHPVALNFPEGRYLKGLVCVIE
jgi:23S rRNA (cytosine1962-C5)-methyltransferase